MSTGGGVPAPLCQGFLKKRKDKMLDLRGQYYIYEAAETADVRQEWMDQLWKAMLLNGPDRSGSITNGELVPDNNPEIRSSQCEESNTETSSTSVDSRCRSIDQESFQSFAVAEEAVYDTPPKWSTNEGEHGVTDSIYDFPNPVIRKLTEHRIDHSSIPCSDWNEHHVSSWLKAIGIKPEHIEKLEKEEVTGPVLRHVSKSYLKELGFGGGQIQLLLCKRDELFAPDKSKTINKRPCFDGEGREDAKHEAVSSSDVTSPETSVSSPQCRYRKFNNNDEHFSYIKHAILPPETGIDNLITPCHEYKSLENACKLEPRKLKIKFASEVIRFACACMNMRANGTIHFGVMDKTKTSYKHGEIIGIPIEDKEVFEDALDYIENCFPTQHSDARQCIKTPKFIPVIDKDCQTQNWIVEVDVVPMVNIVRDKLYSARIPKFNEKTNKVEYEQKAYYQRVGPNTPRITEDELVRFIQALKDVDQKREWEENNQNQIQAHFKEDLGRKLLVLLTHGKKYIDNTLRYIMVSNRFDQENLQNTKFLAHMNIFCVFDYDPDSKLSGLCHNYQEHHAVNLHFLHDYDHRGNTADFVKKLQLYDRTSWIFCNGRSDYMGRESPCDEKTWIKNKKKLLKRAVSVICNEILPKRSFVVLFILTSDVEQPLVDTFHEFYAEMSGHEDIVIISESRDNYKKWSSLAQVSCSMDVLEQISIAGMPMSHVDATVQSIQLTSLQATRRLPVSNNGVCFLKPVDEDSMISLEVVRVDQCDETNVHVMEQEQIQKIEQYFYQGGKIDWMNLWLADRNRCGQVIKRDAYAEINKMLEDLERADSLKRSIENINIYHEPGSGGSTVARQILWNWRKKMRCAVVKQSYQASTVCEHAVQLWNYEEVDKNVCLPVLLLLEDCNTDYQDDLRRELSNAVTTMKISPSKLCFIILCCKRSLDPERMCKTLPLRTVGVTHKLSSEEKKLFSKKAESLKFEPEFILTFVLMSKEFEQSYVTDFVENLLKEIDHSSLQTQLIKFVALLNSHIEDSYMSVSHCEAFLGLGIHMDKCLTWADEVRYRTFENFLSEQARFFFIQLKSSETHISSVRIIHYLIAKEILKQLSSYQSQSEIAMSLLKDNVLFDNRFGRDDFRKFVRDLFIKRTKKSKGDPKNSWFSPLIEHICETEDLEKAIDLLKVACTRFEDAFVAQQLARLLYENKRFVEAEIWAKKAKSRPPQHTYILDTLGQVYKKWFYDKYEDIRKKDSIEPNNVTDIIDTALKGINAFRESEKCPHTDSVNNSYFGEVDIGCRLLDLLSSVDIFSTKVGKRKLLDYLLTNYIPEEVQKPWQMFHGLLKGLKNSIRKALECICEDLARFQNYSSEEEEELVEGEPDKVNNPRKWLFRKSSVYARFFSIDNEPDEAVDTKTVSLFRRQMKIFELGGGNVTTILYLLSDKKKHSAGARLEEIISLFPADLNKDLDQTELINFIFCQIALSCASPGSRKLLSIEKLQDLCKPFHIERRTPFPETAYFLLSLLFWPEDSMSSVPSQASIKICTKAIKHLHSDVKSAATGKGRIFTHFFLGKESGLKKIVHKTTIEKFCKGTLSERRLRWQGGEVWTNSDIVQLLKRVAGYTEDGNLFIRISDHNIRVIPLFSASLPSSNENVTFYLGFSLHGVVAFDIEVAK
ncbi:sterile alpha motif domain-containing 9-like protein [Labeo rohita]|uniref:Sterile alpha motif domain-containing 9-like protein n=1 Tax=Labeo rohita TaxID=84645 RepID=A0A498N4R5_LABRO|nr:sterile alpha motif domain-containing 9-like protein [Labeo rohita]